MYVLRYTSSWASLLVLMVKSLPVKAGDIRHMGLNPKLGRSPGGGHGNPLQYSCLENPLDSGAWWAMVRRVTKSQTCLKQLSMHAHIFPHGYIQRVKQAPFHREAA